MPANLTATIGFPHKCPVGQSSGFAMEASAPQARKVAAQVRSAAEVGDIAAIEQALQALPEGSAQRRTLAQLADDFDLAGLQQAARELENTTGG